MSKIYQALEALTQGFKTNKETKAQRASFSKLAVGLSAMTGLLLVSYVNNGLFFGQLLVVSAILTCILFIKTMGNG